jgi:CheY-like chemotaxis protein
MPIKVLVVEDDPYNADILRYLLNRQTFDLVLFNNGEAAIQSLGTNRYDAAVIDLSLPNIDGWGVMQGIRNHPDHHHIPCVAITAYDDVHVAEQALKAGFTRYFPKPLPRSFGQAIQALFPNVL